MILNKAKRDKMPKSDFAGPGETFPDSDPTHARLAIGGATRAFNAGNISQSEEESIKAKARKKLGKSNPRQQAIIANAIRGRR